MALADVATLAADVAFKAKVKAALANRAVAVAVNTATNDEQTALARAIIANPDLYADAVAYCVAADKDGVATAVDTDAEINQSVGRIFNGLARR